MKYRTADLQSTLDWLYQIVASSLKKYFRQAASFEVYHIDFYSANPWLAKFCETHKPTHEEFVILMLALIPHIQPNFFGHIMAEHLPEGGDFPEFGGVRATNQRGILPTGETALFILAGDDLEKRFDIQCLLSSEHWFAQKRILWLDPVPEGEPLMSGRLIIEPEIVELLVVG